MVGCPNLHPLISTSLSLQQPPMDTLALPDLSKINLFSKKKPDPDSIVNTSQPPLVS
ncbi:trafficking protein particle complex subunit-like protein [Medicago truncatula]|uniref:Trafficking protein particle complex subunit-like protein n=1 Tax=Medicago truncatula TaxID=3880 RepID=A0A072V222_MEDTR|nr:trafficking protein particle complex subunit-like protein [Medicago truncatula]